MRKLSEICRQPYSFFLGLFFVVACFSEFGVYAKGKKNPDQKEVLGSVKDSEDSGRITLFNAEGESVPLEVNSEKKDGSSKKEALEPIKDGKDDGRKRSLVYRG